MQGDSKEVGAKVVYQGREMIVSQGVDSDGDMRMISFCETRSTPIYIQ